jgi:restriction endonuclease Mrr
LDTVETGDGGIDAVLQEAAHGLDAVDLQAKSYKDGSNIGARDIRQFLGSLVGNRATALHAAIFTRCTHGIVASKAVA